MKKLLCILLSVVMVLSPAFVMGASAADGYVVKNPVTDSFSSVEEFVAENGTKEFYGYTYDFLYNGAGFVDWSKLDIVYEKDGVQTQSTGIKLGAARADFNSYLRRVVSNFFSGEKLYTEEYATILVNFIGKMIDPYYVEKTVSFGANANPNEVTFFRFVADESGLSKLIDHNWCKQDINFRPFLTAFGVNLANVYSDDYNNGQAIATELLRAAVETIIFGGPLDYMFNLICHFSSNFSGDLQKATHALFAKKISYGGYTTEQLNSVDGLLEIMFGNITDYSFMPFPNVRVAMAKDAEEALLFIMMYFAMNYMYKDNAAVVDGLAAKINGFLGTYSRYSAAGYNAEEIETVKTNISNIVECIFKGDISMESIEMIATLSQENLDSISDDLLTRIKNSIAKLIRKIVDYFDYLFKLFSGEIEYGQPY